MRFDEIGNAYSASVELIMSPQVGREELAKVIGYRTNAGAPTSVVPRFIGEKLFDTSGLDFYVAFGVASGNWTPMGINTLTATELGYLDGALTTNLVASKAAILGTGGALTLGGSLTAVGSIIIGSADLDETDLEKLDGITNGTVAANKAIIPTTDKHIDALVISDGGLALGAGAGTAVTATAAELNYLDIAALGTGAASKAIVLDANGAYVGPTAATTKLTWSVTSDSTDGGTSVEPFVHNTTMTGIGGVGGRARFELDTNVALGAWANALKAQTQFGATGRVTGLGSAFVAEMILSAGCTEGNYAPLELELGTPSGALCGTATALIYGSVNDADAGTFDTNGFILNLAGLSAGASNVFRTGLTAATINAATTAALRIKIGATTYYIPLATATA